MENNFKSYFLVAMIFCISVVSIGTSLFLLNGNSFNLLKKRMGASIVDAVPSKSLITDVEFYAELVDSYNAEKGTSYDYTHNFTKAELASLKTLVIDENGPNYHGHAVADLSGLTYLTGLESLSLKNIRVSSIDLSKNVLLTNLTIYDNGITKLDLRNNPELINLDIDIPTITVLNLFNNNKLESVNTSKPLSSDATIIVKKGHDYSYLFGSSSSQDASVRDNSFGIICGKYNLSVGETTSCTVKGKTSEEMSVLMFKLNKNNDNISISNIQKAIQLNGNLEVVYFGNIPNNEEFNIITFDVTAVSNGKSSINLVDYDEENPLGYVKKSDSSIVLADSNITKTFYVDKYIIADSTQSTVTSGKLKTNYTLNIVGENGLYNIAYNIAVLGDVFADGRINAQDVGKAYVTTATSTTSSLTIAERNALDYNFDGYYNLLDVNQIYGNLN